ncbi:hypothetical protein NVV78_07770 [Pediococcus ethanolidurans]|uniref:hypothetical protein n=1 Tax=Pediococcus ethanolidurans TaxID=319653 RepID=UPI0021E943A9|nr:hypothetical protein [Pediococcus ethanolidurans]MCV3315837.1 hypothetical protein [Pediococcus ethanolidurans]
MELQVTLPPEYDEHLKQEVMSTITEAVNEVRQQTGIDSPWLSSKQATAKWLGVSVETLNALILQGMPIHQQTGKNFFSKAEITQYLLNN